MIWRKLMGTMVALAWLASSRAADEPATAWARPECRYRVKATVTTMGVTETDAPVHVRLNFTPMLGKGEQLDPASIRVVEHDAKTGAALAEAPCLFQPVDDPWPTPQPLNWQDPYDPATPPFVRATTENPLHPASSLAERRRGGYWLAGSATPPWIVAIDLGEVRTINTILPRPVNDGRGKRAASSATIEVATESADGLTEGNWEVVGGWQGLSSPYVFGMVRAVCFPPRPVRYVRMVITRTTGDQPALGALDVRRPFWDPAERAEGRVSWFVPGETAAPRSYYVYFNAAGGEPRPAAVPERVALIQEAEEAINVSQPSGVRFSGAYDTSASGPSTPNMLTVKWKEDRFEYPATYAINVPREGEYTVAFRARGNPGDHGLRVLLDNRVIYEGVFSLEGQDWNVVSLPLLKLTAGVHSLDLIMRQGAGDQPLDLDVLTIVNAPELTTHQGLRAAPGEVETRP